MKVTSHFIKRLHLDSQYSLLTGRASQLVYELFKILDTRGVGSLDDIQWRAFLSTSTDLTKKQITKVFDIFDLDRSGSCEFDEFFLLVCMLVAIKDNQIKQFLYRHWRTCFELLDEDGSKSVSREEFETLGFLFNFSRGAVKKIYDVFDVSGNSELDYNEFRLFIFAAIDMQAEMEKQAKEHQQKNKLDPIRSENEEMFSFTGTKKLIKKKERPQSGLDQSQKIFLNSTDALPNTPDS